MRQGESVASTDLDRHRVVILNDVAALSSGDVLKNFVSKGGGLLVVLGERANWGTDSNDLLPAVPANVVDRQGRGGALAELDTSHPVLEIFKAPRSGNLSTARFFRYRAVTLKPEPAGDKEGEHGPNNRVVARFDDGAIAMAERRIGSGHVMLWASTLDNYWNDLAKKPVYLPFVHEVVRHLATYEEPANWFTIGEVIDPGHLLRASGLGMQSGTGAMVLTPSGQRIEQSGTPTPVQLEQAGFYEVHGRSNQSGTVSVAANLDTLESDLTVLDTQELTAALAGRPGSVNPAAADAATLDAGRSGAPPEFLVVPVDGGHRAARPRNRDLEPHEGARRRHADHARRRVGESARPITTLTVHFFSEQFFATLGRQRAARIAAISR